MQRMTNENPKPRHVGWGGNTWINKDTNKRDEDIENDKEEDNKDAEDGEGGK